MIFDIAFGSALILQAAVLTLGFVTWRAKRSRVSGFFFVALICYVVARNSPFLLGFITEMSFPHHSATAAQRKTLRWAEYYFDKVTFQILFLVFMLLGLWSLRTERPVA